MIPRKSHTSQRDNVLIDRAGPVPDASRGFRPGAICEGV